MQTQSSTEEKRYQLRQMVLINAGTNKNVPSARITAIDPRGGAAVLGANGVGKTTTLRLLPLFFGYLPSKLATGASGPSGTIRFLLPNDTSAIAYEYQRGDGGDLRLAVLRRRTDDENAPVYRIYRSGFDERLFVKDGLFLTDAESQDQANELGIESTKMLSSPEYRSVILRSSNPLKDKRLRDYRVEHSFGPNSLDLLDRLMGAMLMDKVDLNDIVQVAISRVQTNMGQSEHGKIPFKQKTSQIEDWVSLRRACEEAIQLAPKVAEQRDAIEKYAKLESTLRGLYWNVSNLRDLKQSAKKEAAESLTLLNTGRAAEIELETTDRNALEALVSERNGEALAAATLSSELGAKWERFVEQDAAVWQTKILNEPALLEKKERLGTRIGLTTAAMTEVVKGFDELKNTATKATAEIVKGFEAKKTGPREEYDASVEKINSQEVVSSNEARNWFEKKASDLSQTITQKSIELGGWQATANRPQADKRFVDALRSANEALLSHGRSLNSAQQNLAVKTAAQVTAIAAFQHQEEVVRQMRSKLSIAETEFDNVQALASPAEGTLLRALRNHPNDHWKSNLAKTLNEELLKRSDLAPEFIELESSTLYGWGLHLDQVSTPAWADDEASRAAIQVALDKVSTAKAHLQSALSALETSSEAVKTAVADLNHAKGELAICEGQADTLDITKEQAEQELSNATRDAGTRAAEKVEELNAELAALNRDLAGVESDKSARLASIQREYNDLRNAALVARNSALKQIDQAIEKAERELQSELTSLDEQVEKRLADSGVDVEGLSGLQKELEDVKDELRQIESHKPLVEAWEEFQAKGGIASVSAARDVAKQAGDRAEASRRDLNAFDDKVRNRNRQFNTDVEALERRISELEIEANSLDHLLSSFDGRPAYVQPTTTLKDKADVLRGQVEEARSDIDLVMVGIRTRHNHISGKLLSGHKQLGKFVENWLSQDTARMGSDIGQAIALCQCHGQIGAEVIRPNNLELKTIFANIDALHNTLLNFKTEVGRVNRQIQDGLSGVTCFERISDLKLRIETTFEDLGFYTKLKKMAELIKNYQSSPAYIDDRELAPREIASALGDFSSVLGRDGSLEINLGAYITVGGSVVDNGTLREFKRQSELEAISSNGLTSLVMITLMIALVNTMRGSDPVYVPWLTDEIGDFDKGNLKALLQMLKDNRIDFVTASPSLDLMQRGYFARRYLFEDRGRVRLYQPHPSSEPKAVVEETSV